MFHLLQGMTEAPVSNRSGLRASLAVVISKPHYDADYYRHDRRVKRLLSKRERVRWQRRETFADRSWQVPKWRYKATDQRR